MIIKLGKVLWEEKGKCYLPRGLTSQFIFLTHLWWIYIQPIVFQEGKPQYLVAFDWQLGYNRAVFIKRIFDAG